MRTLDPKEIIDIGVQGFSSLNGPNVYWDSDITLTGHSLSGSTVSLFVDSPVIASITYPQHLYLKMDNIEGYKIAQIYYYKVKDKGGFKIEARYESR